MTAVQLSVLIYFKTFSRFIRNPTAFLRTQIVSQTAFIVS